MVQFFFFFRYLIFQFSKVQYQLQKKNITPNLQKKNNKYNTKSSIT